MLYRVIYPIYRLEADSADEAKYKVEKIIHEGLSLIRVEPVHQKQSVLGMFLWGPK